MAKGYSARNGFGGSAGMMRQQQQMQQKLEGCSRIWKLPRRTWRRAASPPP